ncbi:MAG TPA: sigma-70 family RNA polymerase sigma factor [Polyangia bacterium]|nr:sigma-70 family RNA polymerase sigma factor [Polyangia bacterium]
MSERDDDLETGLPQEAEQEAEQDAEPGAALADGGEADGAERHGAIDVDEVVPPAAPGALAPLRDPVARFLAEARRYRRLSDDEERELGRAVREKGDMNAARRLVVHNLRLVISIAYQYRRAWASILDLFQEGSVGLMEAVKRWEPSLGPRFGTYAAYWIRAYVLRFLMTNSRLIHVGNTRAGRKLFFRLEKERQKLLAAGFEPTPKLLAAKLDVDERELDEVRQHLESREVSIDPRGSSDEESFPLAERIAADGRSPESEAAHAELDDAVRGFVGEFRDGLKDARERAVWHEHLATDEPVALGELGARFGVSKQRMGQIADQLKKRFRAEILDKLGPDVRTDWLGAQED